MISSWYDKVCAWFKDSTTILWARIQVLLAAVWGVLTTVDLAPVLNQKWLTVWLIVSGTVTELARRRTL
jgi:hypothetical protein